MSSGPRSSIGSQNGSKPPEKMKRGYRACLHCRSRKAKCDLGDIDAPSSPPCSRCRRESRECVFAPSRRGGNNARRTSMDSEEPARRPSLRTMDPPQSPQVEYGSGTLRPEFMGLDHMSMDPGYPYRPHGDPLTMSMDHPDAYDHRASIYPRPASQSLSADGISPAGDVKKGPSPPGVPALPQHPPSRPARSPTPSPKRRRLHLNPPLHAADPSSIVVADMQNESDALHILALASGQSESRDEGTESKALTSRGTSVDEGERIGPRSGPRRMSKAHRGAGAKLEDFALVKLGIASVDQIRQLTDRFFQYHHHLFPMVPSSIIPHTVQELGRFSRDEPYLLTAMIIIASRNHQGQGMRQVHHRAWQVMRGWLSDVENLGAPPTVGLIESLLLLAENLPRDPPRDDHPPELHAFQLGEELHSKENRQAWMLIGSAIRGAYGLGLDKLGMKRFDEEDRTFDLERGRLAWTYCYLFDRHVSLRLGKAFWSRGPAVCFQGFSSSNQTGPAAADDNFPFLRELQDSDDDASQDDLAGLIQAYVELTQMMSSAHDILYPNPSRTKSLVVYGEYFKYIDELVRSLDGFKVLWGKKRWKTFPLNDAVWAMFYYAQLYICAFSYQAHVERAAMRAEEEYQKLEKKHKDKGLPGEPTRPPLSLFPRGAAHSPDARYIFQSCDAARALLRICVDSLHPGGALPFLPSRFLLWFTYAAILLLKAVYSGAVLRDDQPKTLTLIDKLCSCFTESSTEDNDPAARYSRQLQGLKRKLSVMSDLSTRNSPTGSTVPLPNTNLDGLVNLDRPISQNANSSRSRPFPPTTSWPDNNQTSISAAEWDNAGMNWSIDPSTNAPSSDFPIGISTGLTPKVATSVAPPHLQPISDMGDMFSGEPSNNNLGFATLEDWFGNTLGDDAAELGNNGGGLDLQDFWMKIGASEAQGGFPFR